MYWGWKSLGLVLCALTMLSLSACEQQESQAAPLEPVNISTGKRLAEKYCASCHGLDGVTSHHHAPFIAGQQANYMVNALIEYKDYVRRDNQAHRSLVAVSKADLTEVAAYYNSLHSKWNPAAYKTKPVVHHKGPSEKSIQAGKRLSKPCKGCHGRTGNSQLQGVPSLAGLQYDYLQSALHAYFTGHRRESKFIMQTFKHMYNRKDVADLAAYFSSLKRRRSSLPVRGNKEAGEKLAKSRCAGCHGYDGNSINATLPSLTGQSQVYLTKAIGDYRDGKRTNSTMGTVAKHLSDKEIKNLSAYFASQKPQVVVGDNSTPGNFDPVGDGAKIAATCNGCHGDNGNSTIQGIPSLSRQQPSYLTAAIKAYRDGERKNSTMQNMVASLSDMNIQNIALYYAFRKPTTSTFKPAGNPAKGKELASTCKNCHGENGNSSKPSIPSLAGQDAQYLAAAIKHYASGGRVNKAMNNTARGLSKEQILDVSAYYAQQKPIKPKGVQQPWPPEALALKCNHCHGENGYSREPDKPRLAGQIQSYLEKALLEYHNNTLRQNSSMHVMAEVLTLAEIKAIANYYSNQK